MHGSQMRNNNVRGVEWGAMIVRGVTRTKLKLTETSH